MPKGFTPKEKDLIRRQLLEKGQEAFALYGLRKTNVEDLTRAAGISKGAFYTFFGSKEELFLEIIEQYEEQFRQEMLASLSQPGLSPRESFKQVLQRSFATWRSAPLLQRFSQEDYQVLLRKLPEERVRAHFQSDDVYVAQMVDLLKARGARIEAGPELVAGLMKALFYADLHAGEIGPQVHPQVIGLLIELVANYLVKE
jgi:AcrR family transcriptional regulator